MIHITNLSHAYRKGSPILESSSVNMTLGRIHGIIGLNGAGKTTFFNIFCGILPIQQGSISIGDKSTSSGQIAYLPAESYFYPYMKAKEYLGLFGSKEAIDKMNLLFQIPLNEYAEDFSTGMQKKLSIMGMLLQNKSICVLDEPYNGLDLESCQVLNMILKRLREAGKTILVSSHIMKSITDICDEIHYLENGKFSESIRPQNYERFASAVETKIAEKQEERVAEIFA